jgi:hypothetical protein
MHVVRVHLKPDDLSQQMATMRMWLDEHRIDLSTFACRHGGDGMVVHVELRLSEQAAAFAERFGGRASRRLAAYPEEDLIEEISSAGALVG